MTTTLLRRAGVVAVAGALTAGIVYASIPDSAGVIHGCYAKSGDAIRVIDNEVTTCKPGETALAWSVRGPQGLPGDTRVLAVGTTDLGTANFVVVPDLGAVNVSCPATYPSPGDLAGDVTITGDLPFDYVKTTATGSTAGLGVTSFSSRTAFPTDRSNTLWLLNNLGQWQFEYFTFAPAVPVNGSPCRTAAVITRIS